MPVITDLRIYGILFCGYYVIRYAWEFIGRPPRWGFWCWTTPESLTQLAFFTTLLMWLLLGKAMGETLEKIRAKFSPYFASRRRLFFAGLIALFFILLIFTSRIWTFGITNSGDEGSYLFQAEMFAQGKLAYKLPHPELDRLLATHYVHASHGKKFSMYPPMTSALLTPFVFLRVPWLGMPFYTVLCLLLILRLAKRFAPPGYENELGPVAGLVFALAPFTIFTGSSFFSHLPVALFALLTCTCLLELHTLLSTPLKLKTIGWALLTGLFVGCIYLTRFYDAVLLGTAVAAFCFPSIFRHPKNTILAGLSMLITFAGCVGLYLLYNHALTNEWTLSPGYVKGNTNLLINTWKEFEDIILDPVNPFPLTRIMVGASWNWTFSALWILLAFGIRRWVTSPLMRISFLMVLFVLLGYGLMKGDGAEGYGSRFLFPAYPFVCLLIANGWTRVAEYSKAWARGILFWSIFTTTVMVTPYFYEHVRDLFQRRSMILLNELKDLKTPAVVFLNHTPLFEPSWHVRHNHYPLEKQPVIFSYPVGPTQEAQRVLKQHWPDRQGYVWDFERWPAMLALPK